eukprot:695827-Alexandrium_andersonii.AAC.1
MGARGAGGAGVLEGSPGGPVAAREGRPAPREPGCPLKSRLGAGASRLGMQGSAGGMGARGSHRVDRCPLPRHRSLRGALCCVLDRLTLPPFPPAPLSPRARLSTISPPKQAGGWAATSPMITLS